MRLSILQKVTGGRLYGAERKITAVKTDSRFVQNGCLFAAIKGERVDGFDFISDLDKSFDNIAYLCDRRPDSINNPALVVDDVIKAIGDIARYHLTHQSAKKIAVTGSVGKTTTKDFITCALSACTSVLAEPGNHNNELGLPLLALKTRPWHKAAVFEMGMRGPRQIKYLASIVRPDIGVITNIGISHIELLGSKENILKAKLELADALGERPLVLNGDDGMLFGARDKVKNPVYYGIENESCLYRAVNISERGRISFDIKEQDELYPVTLSVYGRHNIYNALAAFAVGRIMGFAPQKLITGIESFKGDGVRQNIKEIGGITILDDAYNASPDSVKAALSVLAQMDGPKTLVLGDMLELGECSVEEHEKIGHTAITSGVSRLVTIGPLAEYAAKAAGGKIQCASFENTGDALAWLLKNVAKGDKILFKGSHALGLDGLIKDFEMGWISGERH